MQNNNMYDNEFAEKMLTMECGEIFNPVGAYGNMKFVRVPGGWICTHKDGTCFIPFSMEFKKIGQ
jgi:hypothetical protein